MVSQVMDDIGASVETRDRYIESTTLDEIILSFQAKWTAGSIYICGSKMEGARTNGMQSDTDIVIVQESLPAIRNIGDTKDHKLCFLIVQDATTPAGYVKLQRVIDGIPQFKSPGSEVIKLFSYSTQLSLKFILLINVKMPTIVGILTFMSRINDWL